jgi:hypothetical protein
MSAEEYVSFPVRLTVRETKVGKKVLVSSFLNRREVCKREMGSLFAHRWNVGVSREGHVFKSVKVRPRVKDSALVAWEAP